MLRVMFQYQMYSRVHPVIVPKLLETCNYISKSQQFLYPVEAPVYYCKKSKSSFSTFKNPYGVTHAELNQHLYELIPKIKYIGTHGVNKLLIYFEKNDYKWGEVKRGKEILLLPFCEVKDRFGVLHEFGYLRPSLEEILHIDTFLQSNLTFLRSHGVYCENFNVIDNLLGRIEALELPQPIFMKISETLQGKEEHSLAEIHLYVLAIYLSHRFNVRLDAMKEFIRTNPLPTWKPLQAYPYICDVIIKVLKLDFYFVMNNPEILSINSDNVSKIIKRCYIIGGNCISDFIMIVPKILLIPHEVLTKWTILLKQNKVTSLIPTPEIVKLFEIDVTEEIEERFVILRKIPEFEDVLNLKKFGDILLNPRAVKRVIELSRTGSVLNRLNLICHESQSQSVKVYGKQNRLINKEMILYIARKLSINNKDPAYVNIKNVRTGLGDANTQMVLELLLDYGFSKVQIISGIKILSLEYKSIKSTLENFAYMPEAQPFDEWMKHPMVVHLLAYLVMRDPPSDECIITTSV